MTNLLCRAKADPCVLALKLDLMLRLEFVVNGSLFGVEASKEDFREVFALCSDFVSVPWEDSNEDDWGSREERVASKLELCCVRRLELSKPDLMDTLVVLVNVGPTPMDLPAVVKPVCRVVSRLEEVVVSLLLLAPPTWDPELEVRRGWVREDFSRWLPVVVAIVTPGECRETQ